MISYDSVATIFFYQFSLYYDVNAIAFSAITFQNKHTTGAGSTDRHLIEFRVDISELVKINSLIKTQAVCQPGGKHLKTQF